MNDEDYMRLAIAEARRAESLGEVPIGAVVVYEPIDRGTRRPLAEPRVISRACNLRETTKNPAGHAEFLAMQEAARVLDAWRLSDCTVYVTLEPCIMCAGLMHQSRIARCVFGASDLKACQYNPQHELYAIVPNRGITSTWLSQAETEVEQNNRLLYDYFRAFEQQLRSRSTYRTRMPSAPYYAVYNVGGYTFAPWKVVWPEQPGNSGLPVAVVNTRTLQGVGEKIVVPDHKIYFAEFDDETTALYLCGLLTCSLVQKFIASFHIMIQVGDIFKHMRLPEFDERNHQHMHLVELVREAHNENDADVRNNLLTQISDIGNSIIETWTPTE